MIGYYKPYNERSNMIIGLFGDVRSGKTLTAVKELYKLFKHGYNIYSNIHLNFPHKFISLKELEQIVEQGKGFGDDDAVVFIDEWHVNFGDSRTSMTKKNRIISYFLLQTGKLGHSKDFGMILIYTSQYPDLVDKRLRKPTMLTGFCEKYSYKGDKKIISVEWHQIQNGNEIIIKELYWAHKYYDLYDTREIVGMEQSTYDEET
jgi:hypothetical protein